MKSDDTLILWVLLIFLSAVGHRLHELPVVRLLEVIFRLQTLSEQHYVGIKRTVMNRANFESGAEHDKILSQFYLFDSRKCIFRSHQYIACLHFSESIHLILARSAAVTHIPQTISCACGLNSADLPSTLALQRVHSTPLQPPKNADASIR